MTREQVVELFKQFISLESVAADPNRYSQILQTVDFLKKNLEEMGFTVKIVKKDNAPPLIVAEKKVSGQAKTFGIYGHYDVQPEEPINEWHTKPFELTLKDGKFYGRGVADDKGHIVQNLVSVRDLIETRKTKNNIVFVLEGEEEIGSRHFEELSLIASDVLSKVDVFYVIDMGMHAKNVPQIFYALRGNYYYELEVTIGEYDLHSGVYGNRVHNPINVLADLITKIKDIRSGKILIPHFYDYMREPNEEELIMLKKVERDDKEEINEAKVYGLVSVNEKHPSLSTKIYPSFDVHGIVGGYNDHGEKTIIPKTARAKFSFRTIEGQRPELIDKHLEQYIKDNLPKEVHFKLKKLSKAEPFYTDINNIYVQKTASVMKEIFQHDTLMNRSGGSIHAAGVLKKLFNKPIILTGFTLPDDRIHAPNENYDEEMFWKGIEVFRRIYSE